MYYKILSQEYLKQAEILRKHIKKLKTHYVQITDSNDEEFKNRISILYSMYLDLIHTGKYLKRKHEVMIKHE